MVFSELRGGPRTANRDGRGTLRRAIRPFVHDTIFVGSTQGYDRREHALFIGLRVVKKTSELRHRVIVAVIGDVSLLLRLTPSRLDVPDVP